MVRRVLMTKCSDEACRKTVEELDLYVKGRPGTDTGIRICLLKFVPKTWIWKFLGWGGIPFIIASFFLFSTVSGGEKDHQQSTKAIDQINVRMERMETSFNGKFEDMHDEVTAQGKELVGQGKVQEAILEGIKDIKKAQALRTQ